MNRLVLGVMAGALGTLFAMPCAVAQSWQDMQSDHDAIEHKEAQIHHDRHELRDDMRNGDYAAANHEEREINGREKQLRNQRQDLREDRSRLEWRHRHHDHHDRDDD
jgi:chromosome segregation ATPase